MITGYNHNIPHSGRTYHIQTEDSGLAHPHIITHLFVGGNIIHSKKRSYAHLLEAKLHEDEEAFEKKLREMMKAQHKEMLKELKAGTHDHVGTRKAAGALLTPGLMEVSAEGDTAEKSPPVAPVAKEPPAPLSALEPPPLDALEADLPPLPESPPSAVEAPATEEIVEELPADAGGRSGVRRSGLRARGGRMGRARPEFKAPPTAPSAGAASGAPTAHDLPSFNSEAGQEEEASGAARRKMRSQRGSGRGKRPELNLQPPSSRMTPAPMSINPAIATGDPVDAPTMEGPKPTLYLVRDAVEQWLNAPQGPQTPPPPSHSTRWGVSAEISGAPTPPPSSGTSAGPIRLSAVQYLKKD